MRRRECAMAAVKVPYQVNSRPFEGMIVYDDSVTTRRPAIFMQPDWKGVCADTIAQARTVAGKDYVVLMADMFGAGYGGQAQDLSGVDGRHEGRPRRPRLHGGLWRDGL